MSGIAGPGLIVNTNSGSPARRRKEAASMTCPRCAIRTLPRGETLCVRCGFVGKHGMNPEYADLMASLLCGRLLSTRDKRQIQGIPHREIKAAVRMN